MRIFLTIVAILFPLTGYSAGEDDTEQKLRLFARIFAIHYDVLCDDGSGRDPNRGGCKYDFTDDILTINAAGNSQKYVEISETNNCEFRAHFANTDSEIASFVKVDFNKLYMYDILVWRAQSPRFRGITINGMEGAFVRESVFKGNRFGWDEEDRLQLTGFSEPQVDPMLKRIEFFQSQYCQGAK